MCPTCGSRKSKVHTTRKYENRIWRRKSCLDCGRLYSTQEIYSEDFRELERGAIEEHEKIMHEQAYLRHKLAVLESYAKEDS